MASGFFASATDACSQPQNFRVNNTERKYFFNVNLVLIIVVTSNLGVF